jgi:hypothetical protein
MVIRVNFQRARRLNGGEAQQSQQDQQSSE